MSKLRPKDLVAFARHCTALPVFRMQELLGSDATLNWSGESPDEFLSLALKAGAKLLYLQTTGESAEHQDEPAEALLAFSCDRLFHAMRVRAPWAPPEEADEEDEGEDPVPMWRALLRQNWQSAGHEVRIWPRLCRPCPARASHGEVALTQNPHLRSGAPWGVRSGRR